ncbi:hypothetical protein [Rhizohabitans arisaemae]|uniref:hypothetical protein n=1 Tax=Rhizohabitans arisaemae TaxID=2720610 RepID=UPI003D160C6F
MFAQLNYDLTGLAHAKDGRDPASSIFQHESSYEQALIIATGLIDADLVAHFDLPDHEQTLL